MSATDNKTASALRSTPLWLGCLFILVAPNFDLIPGVGTYDEKRLIQLGVLTLTVAWVLASPAARTAWLQIFAGIPGIGRALLGVVVLGGIASSFTAMSPRAGVLEVSSLTMLFVMTLAVAASCSTTGERASSAIVAAITLSSAAYLAGFLLLYAAGLYVDVGAPPSHREVWPGFAHVRFLGQWQTWTLPLIVLPTLMWPDASKPMRVGQLSLAAGWWALLAAAGTRGTYVAEATAFTCVALLFGRGALPWLRLQARAIIGGFVLYIVGYVVVAGDRSAFMDMFTHMVSQSTSGRMQLWQSAIDAATSAPLLGVGPQHYVYIRPSGAFAAHPHNAVLQWASEWGVLSTAVVGVLAAWALVAWLRGRKRELAEHVDTPASIVAVALSASLIAGVAHSMLSGIIVMPMSQMQMVVVIGWAMSLHLQPSLDPSWPAASKAHLLLIAGAVASMLLLFAAAAPDMGARQFDLKSHEETIGPRFWLHGKLSSSES